MSLKKYMAVDLLMLAMIGIIVEIVGMYAFSAMLNARMITTAMSILIMIVAVTRWGWKGLILAPILALATILSGRFLNPKPDYAVNYEWQLYISSVAQLLATSISLLWFKKFKDEQTTFKSVGASLGFAAMNSVVSFIVLNIIYIIISLIIGKGFVAFNLIMGFMAWNAFGYVMAIVGTFILSRQGILINVEKELKRKKKEKREEEIFKMNLESEEDEKDDSNFENKEGD